LQTKEYQIALNQIAQGICTREKTEQQLASKDKQESTFLERLKKKHNKVTIEKV